MNKELLKFIKKMGTCNEYNEENDYINRLIRVYYYYNFEKLDNIDIIIEDNLNKMKKNINDDILYKKFINEEEKINSFEMVYAFFFEKKLAFSRIRNSEDEYLRLTEVLLNKVKEVKNDTI